MIEELETETIRIRAFRFIGEIDDRDYSALTSSIDAATSSQGKIRMLVDLDASFRGWDLHAAWDDLWLTINHYNDIERIAVVGTHQSKEWVSRLRWPVTKGDVRYFEDIERTAAWNWVREDVA